MIDTKLLYKNKSLKFHEEKSTNRIQTTVTNKK